MPDEHSALEAAQQEIAELASLVASARALAEWHRDAGSEGLVTEADPFQLAGLLAPKPKGRGRPGPQGRPGPPMPPAFKPLRPNPQYATTVEQPQGAAAPKPTGLGPLAAALPSAVLPPAPIVDQPKLGSAERLNQLTVLATTVASCTRCELHATRTQTVFSRGNPDAELVFIGEGPGADEDAQGLPFVGKAGQLLDKMIEAMGMSEREVYICNIVKCRPPGNRTPEPREMASCMPYLTEQLSVIQPKALVALGATALRGLFGPGEGIAKARGNFRLYQGAIPVMPTFHPAYVLRQPTKEIRGMVWSDLQQVLKHLGRTVPKRS